MVVGGASSVENGENVSSHAPVAIKPDAAGNIYILIIIC